MARIVAVVTARGGSKGIPRKNLATLAGKPLIAWTFDAARRAASLDRVILSTDDGEIATFARSQGVDVPFMRPAALAGDASPHVDVLLHALDWLDEHEHQAPEYVVTLQPTSPLRTGGDIDAAVRLALERRADAVVSVCPAHTHPLLARRLEADGRLVPFVEGGPAYARRQDLPPAYALNGAVYVNRCASLRQTKTLLPPGAIGYVMPVERSLEVDTPWDLRVVELVLQHAS